MKRPLKMSIMSWLKLITCSLNSLALLQWHFDMQQEAGDIFDFWFGGVHQHRSVYLLFYHLQCLNVCIFVVSTLTVFTFCIPGNKQSKRQTSCHGHIVFGKNKYQITHSGTTALYLSTCLVHWWLPFWQATQTAVLSGLLWAL